MSSKRRYYVNVLTAIERIVAVDAVTETEALEKASALPGVIRVLEVFDSAAIDNGISIEGGGKSYVENTRLTR